MPNSPFTPEQISQILEEFFKVVGTRQYIGARYVPIFGRKGEQSIQWDNTKPYEPLTIVLYQGNSYTSRQYVPEGVEITNELFWALTGDYNAQIEAYRREVQGFGERIDVVEASDATQAAQLAGTSSSGLKTLIETNTENLTNVYEQLAGTTDSGLRGLINQNAADILTHTGQLAGNESSGLKTLIDANTARIDALGRISAPIMVEDYGAIGDGVTDSTQAIQDAIAENPNSLIVFKGGDYVISDTIHCWGNTGGCYIELGGSILHWVGGSEPMFSIDRTNALVQGDYLYPYLDRNPKEGKCVIDGGCIANAYDAIHARAFHSIVTSIKIINATHYGIVVGDPTEHISLQGMFDNILIMKGSANQYWSEEASERGQRMEDCPTALVCYDPDNIFSNININRYVNSVMIRNGGQLFSNCHFTTSYKAARTAMADSCAINANVETPTAAYSNKFTNCYFDNMRYIIYAPVATRQYFELSNCFYFNSGRQIVSTVTSYDAYVTNPNASYVSVKDMVVIPVGGRCRLFDAAIVRPVNFQLQAMSNLEQKYVAAIYGNTEQAFVPYTAAQSTDGQLVNVLHSTTEIDSGDNVCIGCVALPGTNINRFNQVEVWVQNRHYLSYHGYLRGTGTSLTLVDDYVTGASRGLFSLYVGAAKTVRLLNNDCMIFPIYIHANQSLSSTPVYVGLDSKNTLVQCYLNPGTSMINVYQSTSYLIQKSFTA